MRRTSSWEGTQEQLVTPWEEMRRASACVSFSMPGAASTTLPPQANALNSSCDTPPGPFLCYGVPQKQGHPTRGRVCGRHRKYAGLRMLTTCAVHSLLKT